LPCPGWGCSCGCSCCSWLLLLLPAAPESRAAPSDKSRPRGPPEESEGRFPSAYRSILGSIFEVSRRLGTRASRLAANRADLHETSLFTMFREGRALHARTENRPEIVRKSSRARFRGERHERRALGSPRRVSNGRPRRPLGAPRHLREPPGRPRGHPGGTTGRPRGAPRSPKTSGNALRGPVGARGWSRARCLIDFGSILGRFWLHFGPAVSSPPAFITASSICSEPTGREAPDTLGASAALNPKKVDSGWSGWDSHFTSGATPTHNNLNKCGGAAPFSPGTP
jgi:hypothetical protein